MEIVLFLLVQVNLQYYKTGLADEACLGPCGR